MYRAVVLCIVYCAIRFKSVHSSQNSTLCQFLKVLPSPLFLTARLNEEELLAWPVSTLRSSRQPTVTASFGLLSQNAFSISSPDLRELLWTPTVFSGLVVSIWRPKLRRLFIDCHTLRPLSMPLPKTVPISVCAFHSVSTARFANISLQASRTFRRRQRGSQHGSLSPDRRCITIIIVSFRGAHRCQQNITSRNYFCKLFLTSRYGRFMDFVKLPRPATALNKLLDLNISSVVYVG